MPRRSANIFPRSKKGCSWLFKYGGGGGGWHLANDSATVIVAKGCILSREPIFHSSARTMYWWRVNRFPFFSRFAVVYCTCRHTLQTVSPPRDLITAEPSTFPNLIATLDSKTFFHQYLHSFPQFR